MDRSQNRYIRELNNDFLKLYNKYRFKMDFNLFFYNVIVVCCGLLFKFSEDPQKSLEMIEDAIRLSVDAMDDIEEVK